MFELTDRSPLPGFQSIHRIRASAIFNSAPPFGGTPPPAAGGGSDDGEGGWVSPRKAAGEFGNALETFRDSSEANDRLLLDLALMRNPDEELRYIADVSKLLNARLEQTENLNGRELLSVLHFMAYVVDSLTSSITVTSTGSLRENPAEPLSYIHNAAGVLYAKLEGRGKADRDVVKEMIDVQRIFAIRGTNYLAQRSEPNEHGVRPFVARTVLMLCNAVYMYNILGREDDADAAESFLDDFKKRYEVPDEEREWIMGVLSEMWESAVERIMSSSANRASMFEEYERDLRTLARSLVVFSPWIYRESGRILDEHGLWDRAQEHFARADTHAKVLARYGASDEIDPSKWS